MKQNKFIKLFDVGNKGYLDKHEEECLKAFLGMRYLSEDILDIEITEENINKLVNKFNLKFTNKDIKTLVEYINKEREF